MNIPIFHTYVDPDASKLVNQVLSSTFLSEGDTVVQFEKMLEATFNIKNVVTVNSGTSALHLALALAGVQPDDEVILPAQTFVATGLVILQQRAKPIFADIDYHTGNISVASISEKISSKTKAIIPVHWGGYPCDMDEIMALAKRHQVAVIEDAAHALGATYRNQPVGTIADFTCFSFQAIKHLTTGDGGAISLRTNHLNDAIAKRWFGIDRKKSPQTELGERDYNITELGFKYHLNNYAAALGIANLKTFEARMHHRLAIAKVYRDGLVNVDGLRLFEYADDRTSAYWLFGMHVENRLNFIRMLRARGVTASVVHQRIDRNDVFGGQHDLPQQAAFDATQIHIPIHPGVSLDEAHQIADCIKAGW